MEPLAEAERETPELVEGIVEAIEDLYEKIGEKNRPGASAPGGGASTRRRSGHAGAHQAGDRKVPSRRAAPQAGQPSR